MIKNRTQEVLLKNINFFPRRPHTDSAGIAVPKQKLQLMDGQNAHTVIALIRPPVKLPLGQSFITKPEPLAIICQDPDGRPCPVPENKDAARKGVRVQNMPAYPGQPVNACPEVDCFDCQKNPHLRRELDHDQNPCSISARAGTEPVADKCNRPPSARVHSICQWSEQGLSTSNCRNWTDLSLIA